MRPSQRSRGASGGWPPTPATGRYASPALAWDEVERGRLADARRALTTVEARGADLASRRWNGAEVMQGYGWGRSGPWDGEA